MAHGSKTPEHSTLSHVRLSLSYRVSAKAWLSITRLGVLLHEIERYSGLDCGLPVDSLRSNQRCWPTLAVMAEAESSIRLFVGGLPMQITRKQLEDRFAAFGKVSAVEVAPSKTQAASCRGYAYVQFGPKDESALQRCLSLVSRLE